MKRTDNYAGNQVRLFLGELKNGTHQTKMKAIQHFQNYIKTYQPNVSDDNVDYLLTGSLDGTTNMGLLHWCGVDSGKHDGQLKRICAPLISLLRWLVTFPEDSIYYERFIHLSKEELVKINFPKHIMRVEGRGAFELSHNQSRSGSIEDAFELLCILVNDHRNVEDDIDPIDIMYLLKGNTHCQEKFEEWLQKADLEHMTEALNQLKNPALGQVNIERVVRPQRWEGVNLKYIPVQEGEDLEEVEEDDVVEELPPIPDPLGLPGIDLRETQELYSTGLLQKSSMYARRNTAALLAFNPSGGLRGISGGRNYRASALDFSGLEGEESDEEDEDDDYRSAITFANTEKRVVPSVIPTEKSFSVPLFLSLVHGKTSFEQLQDGLDHLKEHLKEQSRSRENLVRNHFGLFVQCAEGLEWLVAYRKGIYKANESGRTPRGSMRRPNNPPEGGIQNRRRTNTFIDKGIEKLTSAQKCLDYAKVEAKSTLAPILERMRMSREIRSAEKVLRGMANLLEYPHQMKKLLERGEFKETIQIYKRIQLIPSTSSLKIVPKIKHAAESVILELRRICYHVMLTPNPSHQVILQHALLLQELDGANVYMDLLRLSFLRQLAHVLELMKLQKEKFFEESLEAFHKGQEINIISNNSLLAKGESDTIAATIRKFTTEVRSRRRTIKTSGGNSGGRKRLISFSDTATPRRTSSRGSFSSESGPNVGGRGGGNFRAGSIVSYVEDDMTNDLMSGGGGDTFTQIDDGEDDFIGSLDFDDDILNISPSPSPAKIAAKEAARRRGSLYSDFLDRDRTESAVQEEMNAATEGGSNLASNQDYCHLFVNVIRKSFAENIVETISRWFPCLFRLSYEIMSQQQKGLGGVMTTNTSGRNNNNNATGAAIPKNPRALTSTSRLIAATLGIATDYLSQTLSGFKESFRQLTFPVELNGAIHELETAWIVIENQYGMKMPATFLLLQQEMDIMTASRFYDIVGTSTFLQPIATNQLRLILDDIFLMYEAIESSITIALSSLNVMMTAHNNGGDFPLPPTTPSHSNQPAIGQLMRFDTMRFMGKTTTAAHIPGVLAGVGGIATSKVNREVVELDYHSATSPYYEPMRSLYTLSQEGVASLAQTILDKMLEKSCAITDRLFSSDGKTRLEEDVGEEDGADEGLTPGEKKIGIEYAVKEFEALIFKGLMALKKYIKRPEWVSGIVHENIFKKIVASFTEGLRRKFLFIDQRKALAKFDQPGGVSPPTRRIRKKSNALSISGPSGGGGRLSMHQNTLILQSLEEELRASDFGWERDHGNLLEKPTAWMDFLRGCVRFRVYSIPLILKQVGKVFSLQESNSLFTSFTSPTANLSPGTGTSREGFTFPAVNTSNGNTTTAPATGGGGGSLLNRLFAFDNSADPMAGPPPTSSPSTTKRPSIATTEDRSTTNNNNTKEGTHKANDPSTKTTNTISTTTATTSGTLESRIINAIKENSKLFNDFSTTGGSYIYENLKEVIAFELNAIRKFLQYRIYSMKTMLLSAYAYLVHIEIQGVAPGSASTSVSTTTSMTTSLYTSSILPAHLSKIILALAEERKILMNYFYQMTIEYGGNKREYYLSSLARLHALGTATTANSTNASATTTNAPAVVASSGSGTVTAVGYGPGGLSIGAQSSKDTVSVHLDPPPFDSDSDQELMNEGNNSSSMNPSQHEFDSFFQLHSPARVGMNRPSIFQRMGSNSQATVGGQAYSTYLFEELCKGVLDCYEEILKKLVTGQLFDLQSLKMTPNTPTSHAGNSTSTTTTTTATSTTIIPYRSLHQCYEEFEFFKALFRPILLNTQILQRNPFTASELQMMTKEKGVITKDELMRTGMALTILIQSGHSPGGGGEGGNHSFRA